MREFITQTADAELHGFATFPFPCRIGFRQTLRLIGRAGRLQAGGDEIVGDSGAVELFLGASFFGLSQQTLTNRNVRVDFCKSFFRSGCTHGLGFRRGRGAAGKRVRQLHTRYIQQLLCSIAWMLVKTCSQADRPS